MPNAEENATKMTPADHAEKLARWIRRECKTNHPAMLGKITEYLPKEGTKLEAWLKKECGIDHLQLKLAIDNTIKAIG